jgi:glutamine amidotransferase-like uncharacterized protein
MTKRYIPTFETFISNSTVGNGIEIDHQSGPNWRTTLGVSSRKLKVCIYFDIGVKQETVSVWELFLTRNLNCVATILSSSQIKKEKLDKFDLFIIPGGSSYSENLGLGDIHKQEIKKYVEAGGKLLAVCAGAFLVTKSHDWSMGIVPLDEMNRLEDLKEDILYLDFDITEKGAEVLNTNRTESRFYFHGGPVFYTKQDEQDVEVLLRFKDSPVRKEIQDFTKGKIAATISKYGKGSILTFSPHLEKSYPDDNLLSNAINYLVEKRWFEVF